MKSASTFRGQSSLTLVWYVDALLLSCKSFRSPVTYPIHYPLKYEEFGSEVGKLRNALGPCLGLQGDGLLPLMCNAGFVLTPDIALKLLFISKRRSVSANVIIQVC